jgi:membrane protein implicated in regulation of membrane protease activity
MTEWIAEFLGEVWWRQWWAWGLLAALCGILELLAPGYIFLGFCIGASAMAGTFLIGAPVTEWLPEGMPALLVVFAALSILAWIGLRVAFRLPGGQVKTFRHDINDD